MNQTSQMLRVVDLFSGSGGMSSGFHRHGGFEIVGAVDRQLAKPGRGKSAGTSNYCNPTYARNIGVEPLDLDLSAVEPADLLDRLGLAPSEVDVLISCAPCTGFSQKNARNHVRDDPRNSLVARTADFVETFQPEFLVMENVKEMLSGNQRHHFVGLATRLGEIGYEYWAEIHDLSSFGLPQRRVRALIIAWRGGRVPPLLPSPGVRMTTVRDAIAHLPALSAGEAHPEDPMHVCPRMTKPVLDRIQAIPKDGGSWGDVMNDPSIPEDRKRYLLTPAMFRARPGSFPDVYGRLSWDAVAVTITRECAHVGNGRYAHPEQDRLLSVREMALLQGFPADYHFEGPLTAKYNQIGDAVPPLVASLIAGHVYKLQADPGALWSETTERQGQLSIL